MAIMDISPINPGHVLLIPLIHAQDFADLEPGTGGALFEAARHVAAAIRQSTLNPAGINLLLAGGEAAGQEVLHVHLHVLPRYLNDGFGHTFPPHYGCRPAREELDNVEASIRTTLPAA
jgi:diadenosine tetraphosphate (Ap4A) HIT family hydrolase